MAISFGVPTRSLAAAATFALVTMGLLNPVTAQADTVPPPAIPETVSTDPLPTVQIDGIVWSQAIVGGRVYAGGNFSTARPAGAAPGTSTVARQNLLAYDLATGQLISSFAPTINGQVTSVSGSPDGTRVYIGGAFSTVNGATRYRVAAFDASTGALISNFAPAVNGAVDVVKATDSRLYIGGNFTAVGSTTRTRAAAVSTTNGAVLPFAPVAEGGRVRGVAVSPDESKVVLAGSFTTLNGSSNPGYGLGAVSADAGTLLPWNANASVRNAGKDAAIYSLASDSDSVYGSGYHFGPGGTIEGAFRADWKNGDLLWVEDCHGDTYSVAATSDAVYTAGHPHYCGNTDGFPQTDPWTFQRGMAWSKSVSSFVNRPDIYGYHSWAGTPAPALLNWWPDFNTGTVSGANQGPWSVAANEDYVVYGGEFTRVNNKAQQGLVRFAKKSIAPNDDGPRLGAADFVPHADSYAAGTVRLSWPANYDRDNQFLTYDLIRDGRTSAPIYTTTEGSRIWFDRPTMGFLDTGLEPGSTHTYQLRARDPHGNTAWGSSVTVQVAASGELSDYAEQVLRDGAASFWRLGERTGPDANDSAGWSDATAQSGVTFGREGAIRGDVNTAASFPGLSTGLVSTRTAIQGPDTFAVEAWFKTTSILGGKIVGFGNRSSGSSSSYDRHVYMDGSGRVLFGVYQGATRVVQSGTGYNDGKWHHVVANLGPNGMELYVDGAKAGERTDTTWGQNYTGYWRIGGDSTWAGSQYFAGTIDEVAIYESPLSAERVSDHYTIGTTGAGSNDAPTATFTATSTGLRAAFDARGSTDADGTVTGYAWNFGDGSSGTGATVTHDYAAAGTYSVTLKVTDDDGATGEVSKQVTVSAPAEPGGDFVIDAFERTQTNGLGTAPTGGAWTTTGSTANYSVDGAGKLRNAPGSTLNAFLNTVSSDDTEVRVSMTPSSRPTAGGVFGMVLGRKVASEDYRARVIASATGTVNLALQRNGTNLRSTTVEGLTYNSGDTLEIRLQVTGTSPTTLQAKVWKTGTTEPADWQVTTTDTTQSLQTAGSVGLATYLSSSAGSTITTAFDNLTARPAE